VHAPHAPCLTLWVPISQAEGDQQGFYKLWIEHGSVKLKVSNASIEDVGEAYSQDSIQSLRILRGIIIGTETLHKTRLITFSQSQSPTHKKQEIPSLWVTCLGFELPNWNHFVKEIQLK
jgi:hypothetical protein